MLLFICLLINLPIVTECWQATRRSGGAGQKVTEQCSKLLITINNTHTHVVLHIYQSNMIRSIWPGKAVSLFAATQKIEMGSNNFLWLNFDTYHSVKMYQLISKLRIHISEFLLIFTHKLGHFLCKWGLWCHWWKKKFFFAWISWREVD